MLYLKNIHLTDGGDRGGFGDCGVLGVVSPNDGSVGGSPKPGGRGTSTLGRCGLVAKIGTGFVTITGWGLPNKSSLSPSPKRGSDTKEKKKANPS